VKITAVERIAHGVMCDRCESITPVANEASRAKGYYVKLWRVTEYHEYVSEELFFDTKECMLEALRWQTSAMTTTKVR
jgi:hypothetical protein